MGGFLLGQKVPLSPPVCLPIILHQKDKDLSPNPEELNCTSNPRAGRGPEPDREAAVSRARHAGPTRSQGHREIPNACCGGLGPVTPCYKAPREHGVLRPGLTRGPWLCAHSRSGSHRKSSVNAWQEAGARVRVRRPGVALQGGGRPLREGECRLRATFHPHPSSCHRVPGPLWRGLLFKENPEIQISI